jgi:hypothetical protein
MIVKKELQQGHHNIYLVLNNVSEQGYGIWNKRCYFFGRKIGRECKIMTKCRKKVNNHFLLI